MDRVIAYRMVLVLMYFDYILPYLSRHTPGHTPGPDGGPLVWLRQFAGLLLYYWSVSVMEEGWEGRAVGGRGQICGFDIPCLNGRAVVRGQRYWQRRLYLLVGTLLVYPPRPL